MNDNPILGHGTHRYQVVTGWGVLDPQQHPIFNCHEMVMDKRKRILVLTHEVDVIKNNFLVYSKEGQLLDAWGQDYIEGHGLTLWDENGTEFLFVCDLKRHLVHKIQLDTRRVIMTIRCPMETGLYDDEAKFKPSGSCIAPNGDIYVVDGYGEQWIFQYNAKGELLRYFGGKGERPDQFQFAHGLCIDARVNGDPQLIVCERMRQHVFKRFTLDGRYLKDFPPLTGAFISRPVIHGDELYSAVLLSAAFSAENWGSKSGFVTILDKQDRCISNPGGSAPVYREGQLQSLTPVGHTFISPHDVLVDDDENLYVAQWMSQRTYPIKLARVR